MPKQSDLKTLKSRVDVLERRFAVLEAAYESKKGEA